MKWIDQLGFWKLTVQGEIPQSSMNCLVLPGNASLIVSTLYRLIEIKK